MNDFIITNADKNATIKFIQNENKASPVDMNLALTMNACRQIEILGQGRVAGQIYSIIKQSLK